jgi:hypothetical protein
MGITPRLGGISLKNKHLNRLDNPEVHLRTDVKFDQHNYRLQVIWNCPLSPEATYCTVCAVE